MAFFSILRTAIHPIPFVTRSHTNSSIHTVDTLEQTEICRGELHFKHLKYQNELFKHIASVGLGMVCLSRFAVQSIFSPSCTTLIQEARATCYAVSWCRAGSFYAADVLTIHLRRVLISPGLLVRHVRLMLAPPLYGFFPSCSNNY
jgi:hypothetical protein